MPLPWMLEEFLTMSYDTPPERLTECACPHFDRSECASMRYRRIDGFTAIGQEWEPCDCACHNVHDYEMDEEDAH